MGHPTYERDANGVGTHASESGWQPPYLPRALLTSKVGLRDYTKTQLDKSIDQGKSKIDLRKDDDFDDDLKRLLTHIEERLGMGLLEAWFSEAGYGDPDAEMEEIIKIFAGEGTPAEKQKKALAKMHDRTDYFFDPEEQWARAFTEIITFAPYASVRSYTDYATSGYAPVYDKFSPHDRGAPRAHPIMVACQDLCTLCVLSRGYTFDALPPAGVTCTADCVDLPAFDTGYGVDGGVGTPTHPKDAPPLKDTNCQSLTALKNKGGQSIPPGSILVYNDGGSKGHDQSGGAHVISVLRVCGQRIEFLNTGAPDPNGFLDNQPFGNLKLAGVGVVGAAKEDLETCALNLAQSRPLGYARLVILDTTTKPETPRFVSKLIHMRHNIASYVWALRGLPIRDLRVVVYIYNPTGTAMSKPLMDDDGLSKSPTELTKAAGVLHHMVAIRGEADGRAYVYRMHCASWEGPPDPPPPTPKPGDPPPPPPPPPGQNVWYANCEIAQNIRYNDPPPEIGLSLPLAIKGTPLTVKGFCLSSITRDARYARKAGAPDGTYDKSNTGVKHFDP